MAGCALVGLSAPLASGASAAPLPGLVRPVATPLARPALWVVGDSDTIIYLFGTFHALDARTLWFDHAVRTAFDGSDELVLETLIPADPAGVRAALAGPVSGGLAGARQAMSAARSAGLSSRVGADEVLQRTAQAERKPVIGLETFAAQLAMYRQLPGPSATSIQASSTPPTPADPAVAAFMRQLLTSWTQGDPRTFEAVVDTLQTQSPQSYRQLFAERNATWAGWIADRLKQPGIVFMAVGTGHLVGHDSVQAQLARRGIRSARVS